MQEIILRVATVSPELTRAASAMILGEYGGFFMAEGFGAYTFADGRTECAPSIAWHIGTTAKDSTRFKFLSRFAMEYCKAGNQESVYMADTDGAAYLAYASGKIEPLA